MARDFSKLISDTQAKHGAQQKEAAEQEAARRRDMENKRTAAVNFLDGTIRPLLEEAAQQLGAQSIPLQIEDNWTNSPGSPMSYMISAASVGATLSNGSGGKVTPKSRKAFFTHDGVTFRVGVGASEYSSHPENPAVVSEAGAEAALDGALEKVITSYLDAAAEYKQGGWR